jgi:hypothetical protein
MSEPFRPWAKALRALCLKKLNDFGGHGTAAQIAADLGKPVELIAPRLSELAELGAIADSGARQSVGGPGRPRVVWKVVDLAEGQGKAEGQAEDGGLRMEDGDAPAWFGRYGQ